VDPYPIFNILLSFARDVLVAVVTSILCQAIQQIIYPYTHFPQQLRSERTAVQWRYRKLRRQSTRQRKH